jgi:hypothetical protein
VTPGTMVAGRGGSGTVVRWKKEGVVGPAGQMGQTPVGLEYIEKKTKKKTCRELVWA